MGTVQSVSKTRYFGGKVDQSPGKNVPIGRDAPFIVEF